MNKELLFKALDSIHQEPERFNMRYYAIEWSNGEPVTSLGVPDDLIRDPACGTTLCLAGWVLHHSPEHLDLLLMLATCALNALGLDRWDDGLGSEMYRVFMNNHGIMTPQYLVLVLEDIGALEPGEFVYG